MHHVNRASWADGGRLAFQLITLFLLNGCVANMTGDSDGNAAFDDDDDGDDVSEDLPEVIAELPGMEDFRPAPARLALLTAAQFRSAIALLLGVEASSVEAPQDVPSHGFSTVGASGLAASATTADTFDRSVRAQVKAVFESESRRRMLTGCADTPDDGCVANFIERFGRRAFRRPLEPEEIARQNDLFGKVDKMAPGGWRGLEMVTTALLASPKFLYVNEQGMFDDDAKVHRLTNFELATRLAFWLTGTPPDDELLDAAQSGKLASAAEIDHHVRRLLGSDFAREALDRFFGELYMLPVDRIEKDASLFPFVAANPQIGALMRRETTELLASLVLDRDTNVTEAFAADHSFIDPLLAEFYGVDPPENGRVDWPADSPRGGLLTHAGLLAALSKEASTIPTRRGRFVRERILCQTIPDPPPDVLMQLPEPTEAAPRTQRQRLEVHNFENACKSCHELLDPVGLVLERFDAAGLYREREDGLTIETHGELDGVEVEDARSLGRAVRDHSDTLPCLVRQMYRHATGHLETPGEEPLVANLGKQLATAAEGRLKQAILQLARHPGFRQLAPPDER